MVTAMPPTDWTNPQSRASLERDEMMLERQLMVATAVMTRRAETMAFIVLCER